MSAMKINNSIGIIVKVSEICPLRCKYCYVFQGSDQSFKDHPSIIPQSVFDRSIQFIKNGFDEVENLQRCKIHLFGGEPLSIGKEYFSYICESVKKNLKDNVSYISVQSNGYYIDDEWIDLFLKYDVHVGISLDGLREENDLNRIDFKGKGTHDIVVNAIKNMQDHGMHVGLLSVINPSHSPQKVYDHFVKELNISSFDLLLPKFTFDDFDKMIFCAKDYGKCLCDFFDAWVQDADPSVSIRFFKSVIDILKGGRSHVYGVGPYIEQSFPWITISSNGDLSPVSEYITMGKEVMYSDANVSTTSLKEFLGYDIFKILSDAGKNLCDKCMKCCWRKVCGGGGIINRFSKKNKWDNPSVFCEGLMELYSHVVSYMLVHSYPLQKIREVLKLDEQSLKKERCYEEVVC